MIMTEDSDEGSYSDSRFVLLDSELNLLYFSGPKKDNYISSDIHVPSYCTTAKEAR